MRAGIVAAVAFAAVAGLSGCDELGLGHKAPAPPPCHCTVAPAPVEHLARLTPPALPPVRHHRGHQRHRTAQASAEAAQSNPPRDHDKPQAPVSHRPIWVDGYGRAHGYSHVTRVADARERRDPWHGYKSKCGDRERE